MPGKTGRKQMPEKERTERYEAHELNMPAPSGKEIATAETLGFDRNRTRPIRIHDDDDEYDDGSQQRRTTTSSAKCNVAKSLGFWYDGTQNRQRTEHTHTEEARHLHTHTQAHVCGAGRYR